MINKFLSVNKEWLVPQNKILWTQNSSWKRKMTKQVKQWYFNSITILLLNQNLNTSSVASTDFINARL